MEEDEMGGACSKHAKEMKNTYKILAEKPQRKSISDT
jgi:hypothetical protein